MEQGGIILNTSYTQNKTITISLLKPYQNANYQVFLTRRNPSFSTWSANIYDNQYYNVTQNSFDLYMEVAYSRAKGDFVWKACGMSAL